eukprot:symbB.v1.2.010583.t1/scaffold686.1/size316167/2
MIIPPGQRSSRLLSFSVEASNISEGSKDVKESKEVRPKAKSKEPKESRAKAVGRPKSAARRESPLAAAARRARDAVAAHSANARAKATAAGTAVAAAGWRSLNLSRNHLLQTMQVQKGLLERWEKCWRHQRLLLALRPSVSCQRTPTKCRRKQPKGRRYWRQHKFCAEKPWI